MLNYGGKVLAENNFPFCIVSHLRPCAHEHWDFKKITSTHTTHLKKPSGRRLFTLVGCLATENTTNEAGETWLLSTDSSRIICQQNVASSRFCLCLFISVHLCLCKYTLKKRSIHSVPCWPIIWSMCACLLSFSQNLSFCLSWCKRFLSIFQTGRSFPKPLLSVAWKIRLHEYEMLKQKLFFK